MSYERITAADVRIGDRIARTRNAEFGEVVGIDPCPSSVWLTLNWPRRSRTYRIRPGYGVKLWREVA
jgi:hypothetical protein